MHTAMHAAMHSCDVCMRCFHAMHAAMQAAIHAAMHAAMHAALSAPVYAVMVSYPQILDVGSGIGRLGSILSKVYYARAPNGSFKNDIQLTVLSTC